MQLLAVLSTFVLSVLAFDNSRFDNLAVYWGQNSYGAVHSDQANFQKSLAFYCQDDSIDVFPLAFLNVFFGTGGKPSINLANTCNSVDNATFPGTNLPNCASLASDIKTCQSKGKIVTLSLGGATGSVGFGSDSQAETFAQTIWDLFFGGSSDTRPFGDAILDGVDLDIEGGGSSGYAAFLTKLRSLASGLNKKLYVTAAPQCVFPDAALSGVLNAVAFDAVYVQFYNNPCGLTHFSEAANWDFGLWDDWARHTSPNPNVKIYVGAPADPTAAGSGYVPPATLATIAKQMRTSFPSFGGVMLWDASQAFANNRYDLAIKNAMKAAGGTGFTFPACSAPAFVVGNNYAGGSTVSFGGYIWQSKWFSNAQPSNSPFGDWSAISACAGSGGGNGGGTSTTSTTAPSGTPASGNCAGVAAWSSSTVYATPGTKVTFNGRLYSSNWWTQNDLPTGQSGAWTDQGACSSSRQRNSRFFRL